MGSTKKNIQLDGVGMPSSSVCITHCLIIPVLIACGVSLFTHLFFLVMFLAASFLSAFEATKKSTNNTPVLLWISFWGFWASVLFQHEFHWLPVTAYAFALLIIIGHLCNNKHGKPCAISTIKK